MDMADLIAFAVVLVMAGGWLWFRTKTNRSVETACVMLGTFQIFAGIAKLLLSGIYGDYAGFAVLALGVTVVVFRKTWNLIVMAAVFILVGVANLATALTQSHYTFILWGVAQFAIAAIMLKFVAQTNRGGSGGRSPAGRGLGVAPPENTRDDAVRAFRGHTSPEER